MTEAIRTILAVDPGDTTGYTLMSWEDGSILDQGQVDFEKFLEVLNKVRLEIDDGHIKLVTIVAEDYRIYRGKAIAQSGSKVTAARVLGILEFFKEYCVIKKIQYQPAGILKQAELASGVKQPKDHSKSHQVDAFNHGYYYLCKIGKAKTVLEKVGYRK